MTTAEFFLCRLVGDDEWTETNEDIDVCSAVEHFTKLLVLDGDVTYRSGDRVQVECKKAGTDFITKWEVAIDFEPSCWAYELVERM